ncbi:hypothetical protein [Streptomyces sp. NPDC056982]|uniref:hypothetical protein n=1 Tax=Streptomyces sp. NPDC056982 TaxID=3345986 RepID=UPI00364397B5
MSEQPAEIPAPPTAQERLAHQQLGETLLTDGGRVMQTPQAKTIAISALADRMSTSTHELALAGFGLTIGTDMAHHLGDGRYVLATHHAEYPSMGADVLRADARDPADPRHADDRVVPMDAPEADTLIRQIAVSELMGSWAYGSNNNVRVLALQEAARREFDLTDVLEWHTPPAIRAAVAMELDYNEDALRDFLRTQYTMTQEALASRNITELISYRALTWHAEDPLPQWAGLEAGASVPASHRPLSSWSADRQIVADWLTQRGGNAVILLERKPAHEILALPLTGLGFLGQKEWVTLPGSRPALLDGVFTGVTAEGEQNAASHITLGTPALTAKAATTAPAAPAEEQTTRWQPGLSTPALVRTDPLDQQIIRVLDGQEPPPHWWPTDDSGYAVQQRDLNFLHIDPAQIKWLATGQSPMGLTPQLYARFGTEMLEALEQDGIDASQVDIRLKGTGSGFFSGLHKTLPNEQDLTGRPEGVQRLRDWFGDSPDRPLRRPYDAMWRLGLESEPSDFDLDINSSAIVQAARTYWRTHHSDRYMGDFMGGHGYLDKQTAKATLPALAQWADRWQQGLQRPLSLGVFESSGPFNATLIGRTLTSHFLDGDWIIHRPDTPMAWRTPRSRIDAPASQPDVTPHRWAALSDAELTTVAQRGRQTAAATGQRVQALTDRHEGLRAAFVDDSGGSVAAQLQAQGAAAELIERARGSALQDITHARQAVVEARNLGASASLQASTAAVELQRRSALSPEQRQAEEAQRQRLAAQRQRQPSTPRRAQHEDRYQPSGQDRSGPSLRR